MASDTASAANGHPLALLVCMAIFVAVASTFFFLIKKRRPDEATPADPKPQEWSSGFASGSSSSSPRKPSPAHGRGYEVFLSFRGADTRKGFTDSLYHSLRDAGVDVFRDSEELHVGEEIGPELLDRIQRSKISIPIFSKNYAFSKWCLREFACMMDCRRKMKQTVLPIFYDVMPDEVQHQKGSYADAFSKHVKDSKLKSGIDVRKWREALKEVGTLKGWDLQNDTNGHEGQLIKLVVKKVLRELKKGHLIVSEDLVSIDDKKMAVMRLLEVGKDDVRIVGMYGMGGIGKTTLAKIIYNETMEKFDSCSFLKDIREASSHFDGLKRLQSQLAAELSRCECREFATTDEGTTELGRRFREKRVLVVLDDIDDNDQLEALVSVAWFAPRSRIIVTTRNKNVLNFTPEELRYEVKEMQLDQSMELFCRHAFRIGTPPVELSALSEDIVETTGGLPLALEVIGSLLYGKKKAIWEETLEKLKRKPHMKVQEKLKISYDSLELEQQKIFLDIACLFIGEDRRMVKHMWEDCKFFPESGLDELIMRSLIKVGHDNTLRMHDQLRDLGREIVRQEDEKEPGNRSRLWHSEEAIGVLEEYKGSAFVEAIRLESRTCFTEQNFRNMSGLRFLQIDYADLDGKFQKLFTNLRYLRWRNSPLRYKPIDLDLRNLVILDLTKSMVTHDWEGWRSIPNGLKLKVLILKGCSKLTRTPNFSLFPNLEVLILEGAPRLRVLNLNMDSCLDMEELPQLCFLKSLEVLSAGYCLSLQKVEGLEKLEALKVLNLAFCYNLCELEGLEELVALEELSIACKNIEKLPNLSNLRALRKMEADFCRKLREIDGLDRLVALEELSIIRCEEIVELPDLSNLKVLRKMHAGGCTKLRRLEGLDELVAIEILIIKECKEIEKLPNFSKLKALQVLNATNCEKLRAIDGLDGLVSLVELCIDGCKEIDRLPNLSSLKLLKRFSANGCQKLQELTGVEELEALEFLSVTESTAIKEFPNLSKLKHLRQLDVSHCAELAELRGLNELENLESLVVSGCNSLAKAWRLDIQNWHNGFLRDQHLKNLKEHLHGLPLREDAF